MKSAADQSEALQEKSAIIHTVHILFSQKNVTLRGRSQFDTEAFQGETMVCTFEIKEDTVNLEEIISLLPAWRRQKALSYRFPIDRFLCAKSFLMLQQMLRSSFGLNECPEFSYKENGKPYLKEHPGIFFNISH